MSHGNQAATPSPERAEWLESLRDEHVRSLSVLLITDLLRLEQVPARAIGLTRERSCSTATKRRWTGLSPTPGSAAGAGRSPAPSWNPWTRIQWNWIG